MTVAATITSKQYTGNGSGTQYAFPNKVFAASDLVVSLFDLNGNQYSFANFTNAALGLTYSVSNVDIDTGCTVVFSSPITLNWTVDIRSVTPETQSTSIKNQGQFLPELHEEAFDRLTREIQDLLRLAYTYSIHGPDNESVPWPALPGPTSRLGQTLMFDPVSGLPVLGSPLVNPLTQAAIAALLNLGITPDESTAGVTPVNTSYAPFDIRRYGGDPTGIVSSDTAIANAVAVCVAAGGGKIRLPNGNYTFANPLNLNSKNAIIFEGDGSADGGAVPGTQMIYTGPGSAPWITLAGASGCWFRDMQLYSTNAAWTGTYISYGAVSNNPANFVGLRNVVIGSTVNGVGNVHLALDQTIVFTADGCNFIGGNPSVTGMASSSYSNVIRFRDCHWVQSYQAPILRQGQSWLFSGCTCEPLQNGAPGFLIGATAGTSPANGLIVEGCWFGDVTNTAPSGAWIDGCLNGAQISGNFFSGNVTSNLSVAIVLRQAAGVAITGNSFSSLVTAINFLAGPCYGITVRGNLANSVTTIYLNSAANVPVGQLDFSLGFGFGIPPGHGQNGLNGYSILPGGSIKQWGTVNPASFGAHAITPFVLPFPTACRNVQLTLTSVASTSATIFPSSFTTTGFTYTLVDGSSTTDVFNWEATGD